MPAKNKIPNSLSADFSFQKDLQKLKYKKFKEKFLAETLPLLQKNPFDARLHNHKLNGNYQNYYSINVTGDIRAIYVLVGKRLIFLRIGSHNQIYG